MLPGGPKVMPACKESPGSQGEPGFPPRLWMGAQPSLAETDQDKVTPDVKEEAVNSVRKSGWKCLLGSSNSCSYLPVASRCEHLWGYWCLCSHLHAQSRHMQTWGVGGVPPPPQPHTYFFPRGVLA